MIQENAFVRNARTSFTHAHVFVFRTLASIIGWVRYLLKAEQKVADFKPETDDMQMFSTVKRPKLPNKSIRSIRSFI